MPSSIARPARYGGASAAAVASSSAIEHDDHPPAVRAQQRQHLAELARPAALAAQDPPDALHARAAHSPAAASRSAGLRVRKTWSGSPFSAISRVQRRRLDQLVVRAARGDAPVLEHDDLVGQRDRRQPVADDERRPRAHQAAQRVLDLGLGGRVDARRRVVQDQDARVAQQRPGDRDALALAAATASGRARRRACRSPRAAPTMKSWMPAWRAALLDLLLRRVRRARMRRSRATVAENRNGSSETIAISRAQRTPGRRRARRRRRPPRCPRSGRTAAGSATPASSCPTPSRRRPRRCGRRRRPGRCRAGSARRRRS